MAGALPQQGAPEASVNVPKRQLLEEDLAGTAEEILRGPGYGQTAYVSTYPRGP
ncbi:MAG: hypothetical protein AVDCRST_MAG25-2098 [uncultured Rubrobacteraceae bacterium]|uniref:Uncharacterized protein n=1 Tax=uncultured Rubrobacteraceae bacterium TaxID=349277 RepID=A0A6J4RER7_9ACTN|nr:MAG: hypothetical protein AVDCRST_MAG25-2098 [uncultured Rubrobacteraceae bacterium]